MSGSGGGGACSVSKVVDVTPGTSYHITIGAAGRGGKGDNNTSGGPGTDGGTTSFGSLAIFEGSGGGHPGSENKPPGGKGVGNGGDGGVMGYPGESSLIARGGNGGPGGGGGGAGDGDGGDGSGKSDHNGHNGVAGGGGGGGGQQITSGNYIGPAGNGGDGAPGQIILKW